MFELGKAMDTAIAQDHTWALDHPETDTDGTRHWRDVVFGTETGYRPLTMHVSVPKSNKPLPLVIFVHGGAWWLGHPNVTNPTYRALGHFPKLLAAGFALARISYRFTSEGPFPMQLHDCKAAVRFLRNRAKLFSVDPDRFAAMGDSAGGHLVLMLGLTSHVKELEGNLGDKEGSSAVQAVVNWFGVTDLLKMNEQALPDGFKAHDDPGSPESRLVGGAVQLQKERARAASPITYVHKNAPPILTQHGTHDRLVPIGQAREMHAALLKTGADSTLDEIEGADHCFWGVPDPCIVERDIAFLREKLR
jgi:acetyl esterase/lipase